MTGPPSVRDQVKFTTATLSRDAEPSKATVAPKPTVTSGPATATGASVSRTVNDPPSVAVFAEGSDAVSVNVKVPTVEEENPCQYDPEEPAMAASRTTALDGSRTWIRTPATATLSVTLAVMFTGRPMPCAGGLAPTERNVGGIRSQISKPVAAVALFPDVSVAHTHAV